MPRYYVYKTSFDDGMYYIGNHKSRRFRHDLLNDGYWGSGTAFKAKVIELWIEYWRNCDDPPSTDMERFLEGCKYDFTGACLNADILGMTKEILQVFDNGVDSRKFEKETIKLFINDPMCLNMKL